MSKTNGGVSVSKNGVLLGGEFIAQVLLTGTGLVTLGSRHFRLIEEWEEEPTISDLVEKLRMPGNQSVIVRSGQRGRLTGELKRQLISTRQRRLEDGSYLFTRCEARLFKK